MKIAKFYLTVDPASAYHRHLVMAISASLVNSIIELRGSLLHVLDSMIEQDEETGHITVQEMDEIVTEAGFAEGVIQAFVERAISSVVGAAFEVRYQYTDSRTQEFMKELVDSLSQVFSLIVEKTNTLPNASALVSALIQLVRTPNPAKMRDVSIAFSHLATDTSLLEVGKPLIPFGDVEGRTTLSRVILSMKEAQQEVAGMVGGSQRNHDMGAVSKEIEAILDKLLKKELDNLSGVASEERPRTFLGWFPVEDETHMLQTARILAAAPSTIKEALAKHNNTDLISLSQGQTSFSDKRPECIELEICANIEGCPDSDFNIDGLTSHKALFETGAKLSFPIFY